jgi:hypothetical protein
MASNDAGLSEPLFRAQREDDQAFSVQLFMVQLFVVPLGCLVAGFVLSLLVVGVLSLIGPTRATSDIATHVVFALTGLCVGSCMQTKYPGFYWSGGRLIWVPLALLFLYGVHTDGLLAWIFSDPRYRGNAIAMVLLTEPTIATCMYSVGVAVTKRRADQRSAAQR